MSFINFNDLRNLINGSYSHLRPVFSAAIIRAVNLAEDLREAMQHPLYSLIMNLISPAVSDAEAIRTYLADERTQESSTRVLFQPFDAPRIEMPAIEMPEVAAIAASPEARAPGMPAIYAAVASAQASLAAAEAPRAEELPRGSAVQRATNNRDFGHVSNFLAAFRRREN